MRMLNKKINALWQSQKKDMGEKGMLWMALIFAIFASFFMIPNKFSDGGLDRVLFRYLIVVFGLLASLSAISYFYIYNKIELQNWIVNIVIFLYKIFLILCFVVCIPVMLFLKITEIILNYRARKIENLENWLIILIIDLFVIMALCYIDIWSVERITEFAAHFMKNKYGFEICKYPVKLFLLLGMFKIEMDMVNKVILKVMNHYGISKIEKRVNKKKKDKENNFSPNEDIVKYINEKNDEIRQYEKSQNEDLKYDLEYQRKTIWKFQLICLIMLFLIATVIPKLLFKNQGDAINVITIFTLLMLYDDKRREWK